VQTFADVFLVHRRRSGGASSGNEDYNLAVVGHDADAAGMGKVVKRVVYVCAQPRLAVAQ